MFLVPLTRHANELSRSFDRLFDDVPFVLQAAACARQRNA